jgi:hypothetical protein
MAEKEPRERKTVAGLRTRWRCLVWGIRGRKMSRARVWAGGGPGEVGEVGDHQNEDEQGDEARLPGDLPQPLRTPDQAADGEAGDGDGRDDGKGGGEPAERIAVDGEQWEADADGKVVEGDEAESAEAPEDEGVEEARERPFLNHFGLAEDFPEEVPDAAADRGELEVRVRLGGAEEFDDRREAPGKTEQGQRQQDEEHRRFNGGQGSHKNTLHHRGWEVGWRGALRPRRGV